VIDILYEDNHLIAVNKVAGELVQGDKTGDAPLADKIKAYLKKKYNTSKALTRLNQQFKERRAHKTYWAIVNQGINPPAGTLTHWLKRNPKMNKSFAHEHEVQESKKSILHYKKIFDLDRYSILEIVLETGRHHQIRSQLTHIGFPIKGDLKYGAKRSNPDASIDLHARTLTIEHPTKKNSIQITAPTPAKPQWNFEPYD
jgi:23S rRNA pseudouridine1911/1915/1917 synthase